METREIEDFEREFDSLRERVNLSLRKACHLNISVTPRLKEAMEYSLFASGKRIRPILAYQAGRLYQGDEDLLLDLVVALEFLHTYSLIHDDLPCMDDSDFRRGMPTCHKKFGEDIATLAGDALLTFAWDLLIQNARTHDVNPGVVLELIQLLSDAVGANGMIAGQVLDLEWENSPDCDQKTLKTIHEYKTGKLFEASLKSGAILSGAPRSEIANLTRYGYHFGLVFQITDDILDITGTTEELGKTAGIDEANSKSTYPSILGLEESRRLAAMHASEGKKALQSHKSDEAGFLRKLLDYLLIRSY